MPLNVDAVTLTLLAVLAALAVLMIGIVIYLLSGRRAAILRARGTATVRATIVEYFRRSGVTVVADCVLTEDGRYTALVESEPMKRFRLSHIIEMTLREHVRKAAGVELDKIYWRFPVKEALQAGAAPAAAAETAAAGAAATAADSGPAQAQSGDKPAKAHELSDEYINEGLEHYRHIPKPEVDELPWEAFEQVTTQQRKEGGAD